MMGHLIIMRGHNIVMRGHHIIMRRRYSVVITEPGIIRDGRNLGMRGCCSELALGHLETNILFRGHPIVIRGHPIVMRGHHPALGGHHTVIGVVILVPDILIVGEAGVQRGRGAGEDRRVELGRVLLVGGGGRLVIADRSLERIYQNSSKDDNT